MKTTSTLAALAAAFVVAGLMIFAPLLGAGSTATLALETTGDIASALNNAGSSVYAVAYINDGTGLTTTPADGGLATEVATAPLTAGETDGSGCITFSATTGRFTVTPCGAGELELTACVTSIHGGNVASTQIGAWAQNGSVITAQNRVTKTEPVDAGAYGNMGCSIATVQAANGDYFSFTLQTSGATRVAMTTRQLGLRVKKVSNHAN